MTVAWLAKKFQALLRYLQVNWLYRV